MSKTSLKYARGLLLAIGEDTRKLEETADNLDIATAVLDEKETRNFFTNPRVTLEKKLNLIDQVFANHTPLRNLLKILITNGRLAELSNIAESFRAVLNESAGVGMARIESASKLNEKQIADLVQALKKMTGKEIAIEAVENPRILGGVKVILGDEVIDLSLTEKLRQLKKAFN